MDRRATPTADYLHKTAGLLTDPAHVTTELIYSGLESVVIFAFGWAVAKAGFNRKMRAEHAKIDAEHGYEHTED